MFAFIGKSAILLALAAEPSSWESFKHWYNEWFNIPGFEAWKFLNLAIFVAVMIHLLKKPLGDAFKAKRDEIRAELIKAEEEKQAALDKLAAADAKIAGLEAEKASIMQKAAAEAADERKRLAEQTEGDAERLKQQADMILSRLSDQTQAGLRRFSAEESLRLAEGKIRARLDGKSDAQLISTAIAEIGGLN
ncbi:MAG: hypothetical protein HS105_12835 [Chloracidobacterium sp.]|nr:hypothetical protein [Chloracidobacterium sp.]MCC6824986.1 hypothetical protein [Acidobacteriota bacterium]MCO5333372.1 hypothetical protein [Pyrinomonadaceae bacterium]